MFFLQDCPATLKNGKYYVSYALFTMTITKVAKVVYKYFIIAFNTHLPIKIFSPYFVDLLVLMGVALSTILLISSGETSNRDIFFTDDAAKKFFPTSKISAQEIRHQFFFIWSNLTIMAHIMGLGNQSKSWKIIILS